MGGKITAREDAGEEQRHERHRRRRPPETGCSASARVCTVFV
jgi:hypothetical protein